MGQELSEGDGGCPAKLLSSEKRDPLVREKQIEVENNVKSTTTENQQGYRKVHPWGNWEDHMMVGDLQAEVHKVPVHVKMENCYVMQVIRFVHTGFQREFPFS